MRKCQILTAVLSLILFSGQLTATLVDPDAFGDQLALGTITVFFESAGTIEATITPGAVAQQGFASVAGFFEFQVTGDTIASPWTLMNLSEDFIRTVNFDLSGSISLFDNDGPDTPDSSIGIAGVIHLGGPMPFTSFELVPWPDPQNKGDMFLQERIIFGPSGTANEFPPQNLFEWQDDTDVIPEPSTLVLLGVGAVGWLAKSFALDPLSRSIRKT